MNRYEKLTILHSNDMHGDFLAEHLDNTLVGGVSMLSGYVSMTRAGNPNTIYCIAGDMFRGSVIDSEYRGVSTVELMNILDPDVVTIGNHEVDYGISHLLFLEKCAQFPIINANLHIKTNGARLFEPYYIKEIGGMKVLFIGILTEDVLSSAKNDGLVGTLVDVEDAAMEVGRICNAYNAMDIDLTVLLTHIGFEEDKQLAALLDPSWGVDIIIGGHSHTFLEEAETVNDILIVQAGTGTDQIGRFDLVIDTEENRVESWKWKPVPINNRTCPRDFVLEKLLNGYKSHTDEKYNRVVTRFMRELTHPVRTQETELGNLFADALQESLGVDIMLLGSGSLRKEQLGPLVLYSDLCEIFPYDDPVYMVKVTGAQFKRMIRRIVRDEVWKGAHTEYYQLSRELEITYSKSEHEFRRFNFRGLPMPDDGVYTLGLQKFHFLNMEDGLGVPIEEVEKLQKARLISTSCTQILDEHLSSHHQQNAQLEDRLTIID